MFRKAALLACTITLALAPLVTKAATAPERIALFRPNDGNTSIWGVSTRPDNDPSDWQDGLLVNDPTNVQFWGWFDITHAFFADINGDDLDDKVMIQTAPTLQTYDGLQVVVTYSGEDDISETDFNAPNGDLYPTAGGDWGWLSAKEPIFGDIDGDNIDDFGVTTTGDVIGAPVADSLQWGMWQSNGTPGVSRDQGSGVNFTQWSPFGVPSLGDIPLLGDINGDGVDDRILHRPDTLEVFIDFSDPNGGWGDSVVDRTATLGDAGDKLALSDINGDGRDDLVLIREFPEWPDSPVSSGGTGIHELFGYYTLPGGDLTTDFSMPDIQDEFGQLVNPAGWQSPDQILFAQLDLPADGLVGDYNGDGVVNAADYTVYRDNIGGDAAAVFAAGSRDPGNVGPIGSSDYVSWRANFGNSGAGTIQFALSAVPEPSTFGLIAVATLGMVTVCRRRCRASH